MYQLVYTSDFWRSHHVVVRVWKILCHQLIKSDCFVGGGKMVRIAWWSTMNTIQTLKTVTLHNVRSRTVNGQSRAVIERTTCVWLLEISASCAWWSVSHPCNYTPIVALDMAIFALCRAGILCCCSAYLEGGVCKGKMLLIDG